MTLDEAIKLNTQLAADLALVQQHTHSKAVKLGIEALKYVEDFREGPYGRELPLLPGETQE